jgi:hypothetical protein
MVEFLASMLRSIAEQMGIIPTEQTALRPGVRAVYRLTIRYHDRRSRDSVATVTRRGGDGAELGVVFYGLFNHKPLIFPVTPQDYTAFSDGLSQLRFDRLDDQSGVPFYGVDLWMFERAAGSFYHSVIVAPELAEGTYWQLVRLAYTHLPEAVREITSE